MMLSSDNIVYADGIVSPTAPAVLAPSRNNFAEMSEPTSESSSPPQKRPPPNRKRNVHFHLWATEEEATLIRSQFAKSGMTSLSAYFRKMAINGYHINIDLSDVRELVSLLRRSSNNISQMAKIANTTRSIFEVDTKNLQRQYDKLWDAASEILKGLAKIK